MNGFSQICLDVPFGTAGPGKRVELIAAGKQEGRVRLAWKGALNQFSKKEAGDDNIAIYGAS